jgi:hypothetical protein
VRVDSRQLGIVDIGGTPLELRPILKYHIA